MTPSTILRSVSCARWQHIMESLHIQDSLMASPELFKFVSVLRIFTAYVSMLPKLVQCSGDLSRPAQRDAAPPCFRCQVQHNRQVFGTIDVFRGQLSCRLISTALQTDVSFFDNPLPLHTAVAPFGGPFLQTLTPNHLIRADKTKPACLTKSSLCSSAALQTMWELTIGTFRFVSRA